MTAILVVLYFLVGLGVTLFAIRRWPEEMHAEKGSTVNGGDGHRAFYFPVWFLWPLFVAGFSLITLFSSLNRFFIWFGRNDREDTPNAD